MSLTTYGANTVDGNGTFSVDVTSFQINGNKRGLEIPRSLRNQEHNYNNRNGNNQDNIIQKHKGGLIMGTLINPLMRQVIRCDILESGTKVFTHDNTMTNILTRMG